jgi:hypothetical protein
LNKKAFELAMPSKIFYTEKHREIQEGILALLNLEPEFLSSRTASSTRAMGDAVQDIIGQHFEALLGDVCAEYSATFARRAMADLAFTDVDGFYYVIDVKTHRLQISFNMPNLTSVERLARFYEDDSNYFVLLMVKYDVEGQQMVVNDVQFVPIEFLSWSCLTIGALGWGQIQIANANIITINENYSRKQWMIELCDTMLTFYPREVLKIDKRLSCFKQVKTRWEQKPL